MWWRLAGLRYGALQTGLWQPTPADDKGHTVASTHGSIPAITITWYGTAWFNIPLNTKGHFGDNFTGQTTQSTMSQHWKTIVKSNRLTANLAMLSWLLPPHVIVVKLHIYMLTRSPNDNYHHKWATKNLDTVMHELYFPMLLVCRLLNNNI